MKHVFDIEMKVEVIDHDIEPKEEQTHDHQGCPAVCHINQVSINDVPQGYINTETILEALGEDAVEQMKNDILDAEKEDADELAGREAYEQCTCGK